MTINIVAWPGLRAEDVNPYTRLIYRPMATLGGNVIDFSFYKPMRRTADVFHVHWPEGIFWNRFSRRYPWLARAYAERLLVAISGVRRRGGAAVWTSHNLTPHDSLHPVHDRIWKDFFPRFRSMIDLVINLTPEAERLLKITYPDLEGKRFAIVPHPHYRTAYPPPAPMQDARAALGVPVDDFMLSCIGNIRPNKGIAEFAGIFSRIAVPGERLMIAGLCDEHDYLLALKSIAGKKAGMIDLQIGRVSEERMIDMYSATDLTVLNFQSILNSGSMLLSLSCDTPICAPALGSVKEFAQKLGDDWVMTLPQPLSEAPLRALIDEAKRKGVKRRSQTAPLPADMAPEEVASRTLREYKMALNISDTSR